MKIIDMSQVMNVHTPRWVGYDGTTIRIASDFLAIFLTGLIAAPAETSARSVAGVMMPTHEILANHKAPALAIENNLFRLGLLSSFRVDSGVCMVRIWSKRRATGGGARLGSDHHGRNNSRSGTLGRSNCCACSSVDFTEVGRLHRGP